MKKISLTTSIVSAFTLVAGVVYFSSSYMHPKFNSLESYSILTYIFALYAFNFYFAFHLFSYDEVSEHKHYIVSLGIIIAFLFTFFFSLLLLPSRFVELYLTDLSNSWSAYFIAAVIAGYSIYCVSKVTNHAVR